MPYSLAAHGKHAHFTGWVSVLPLPAAHVTISVALFHSLPISKHSNANLILMSIWYNNASPPPNSRHHTEAIQIHRTAPKHNFKSQAEPFMAVCFSFEKDEGLCLRKTETNSLQLKTEGVFYTADTLSARHKGGLGGCGGVQDISWT